MIMRLRPGVRAAVMGVAARSPDEWPPGLVGPVRSVY